MESQSDVEGRVCSGGEEAIVQYYCQVGNKCSSRAWFEQPMPGNCNRARVNRSRRQIKAAHAVQVVSDVISENCKMFRLCTILHGYHTSVKRKIGKNQNRH